MDKYFVYIVECSDGTLYTGISQDYVSRIRDHNLGKGASYTRSRRPVKLVYLEIRNDYNSARGRELAIKRMRRTKKLQLCIWYDRKKFLGRKT